MKLFFRCFILIVLIAAVKTGYCAEPITIGYVNRIPYFYMDQGGKFTGVMAKPVTAAFKKAGIPYKLRELPAKRILIYLKNRRPNFCSMGWYKNPEREKFATYSLPVYRNKSRIAVTRHDNDLIISNKTLAEVFKIPGIKLLKKDGYSYGKFIDQQIAMHEPETIITTMENDQMLKLVFCSKSIYFFLSEEEADALIPMAGYNPSDFKYIHFSDVPVGLIRYVLFSKQVDPAIVEKINLAIKEIVPSL